MKPEHTTNATQIPASTLADATAFAAWATGCPHDTMLAASVIADCPAVALVQGVPNEVVEDCRRLPRTYADCGRMAGRGIDVDARMANVAGGLAANAQATIRAIGWVRAADMGTLRL